MAKKKKYTLEQKLILDGWFDNEKEILSWLMGRKILVDNEVITSGKAKISEDAVIHIKEYYKRKYVNKGGLKLEKAIWDFGIDIAGKIALDCGASTGGFTDCLLQHGAKKVYAVDVGFGQLSGKLRQDGRVVNLEKTNLSDEILLKLVEKPSIITLDLSYLSLKKAVPICEPVFENSTGSLLCLVKPLFEVESTEIRRTGEINDENILTDILLDLFFYFKERGYHVKGVTNSPVTGNKGTVEFFMYIELGKEISEFVDEELIKLQIKSAVESGMTLHKFSKKDA